MRVLLLRLEGSLQSWGTDGRFGIRQTDLEPSKSGVLGLLGAALGMARDDHDQLARLRTLAFGVRVDREGSVTRDYHTVGGGTFRGAEHGLHEIGGTAVTQRFYLIDASFTVAIAHDDVVWIESIADAVQDPVYPLFLGRRACPLSRPPFLAVVDGAISDALRSAPRAEGVPDEVPLRCVVDASPNELGVERSDEPMSFERFRRAFRPRRVREEWTS